MGDEKSIGIGKRGGVCTEPRRGVSGPGKSSGSGGPAAPRWQLRRPRKMEAPAAPTEEPAKATKKAKSTKKKTTKKSKKAKKKATTEEAPQ